MRFAVLRFSGPNLGSEEEGDSLICSKSMDYVAHADVVGPNLQTGFFFGFSRHCGPGGFVAVNVACDHAVVPVFVSCVVPTKQEDFLLLEQEEVGFRDEGEVRHGATNDRGGVL